MNYYTLKVEDVISETPDTVTLRFKQPALKKFKYKPGQYLTIILNINGRKYRRPYSIATALGIDQTLDITIKRVEGGVVSNYVNDEIRPGQLIEVMEAVGDFVHENESANQVILWGGGSGITPLMSILKQILFTEEKTNVTLVYSNRDEQNIIYKAELEKLKKEFSSRFEYLKIFTRQELEEIDAFHWGRIDHAIVERFFFGSPLAINAKHYLCGPDAMQISIIESLKAHGVEEKNIFSESFTHDAVSIDLQGVIDQNVILIYEGIEQEVKVPAGKSILDAALDAGLDLPYSCQTGQCLVCKATRSDGEIKMAKLKHSKDLLNGEFLLCCSYPLTDNVKMHVFEK